jgi:radical SAM superfamily enzyme YgiQ (UPF0313 family)
MTARARLTDQAFDIALCICPPWDVATPPLGLAYVSRYLEFQGFRPKVVDLNITLYHEMSQEMRSFLWEFGSFKMWEEQGCRILGEDFERHLAWCVDHLLAVDTKVFGFSLYHANVALTVEVARRLKQAKPQTKVVFGGPSCLDPFDRDSFSKAEIDFCIAGEGELALAEILFRMHKVEEGGGTAVNWLPGCQAPCHKNIIPDLDAIPFPTYRDFPLEMYEAPRILRVIGSRGCIARCRFCNENFYTGRYRVRSAEKVMAELMHHRQEHRVNTFIFSDQEVNGNLTELETLCDLLIGNEIHWSGQAIIRPGMTRKLLRKMRRAGCHSLDFGLESGSDTVLRRMGKPFTVRAAEKVLALSHEAGIVTGINLITGFPGETEAELLETFAFLERNRTHLDKISNISTFFVKPFSDCYFYPQKYGIFMPEAAYFWYLWQDLRQPDNRSNEQRITKLGRLTDFCREMGIHFENIYCFR